MTETILLFSLTQPLKWSCRCWYIIASYWSKIFLKPRNASQAGAQSGAQCDSSLRNKNWQQMGGVQLKCAMCNCAYDTAENISKRMFYTFEKKSCFWVIAKSSWETWAILVKESSKVVGSFHLKGSGLSDNDHLVYAAWTIPLSFTFIFTYGHQLTRARQFQASSLNSSLKSCQTLTKMPPHVLNNNMRLLLFSRHLSPCVSLAKTADGEERPSKEAASLALYFHIRAYMASK